VPTAAAENLVWLSLQRFAKVAADNRWIPSVGDTQKKIVSQKSYLSKILAEGRRILTADKKRHLLLFRRFLLQKL
jgi:hypothetical protein